MTMFQIRCYKAKESLEVDTDRIPESVYHEALILGLHHLVNRGMAITGYISRTEITKKEAKAKAAENISNIYEGNIRFSKAETRT